MIFDTDRDMEIARLHAFILAVANRLADAAEVLAKIAEWHLEKRTDQGDQRRMKTAAPLG